MSYTASRLKSRLSKLQFSITAFTMRSLHKAQDVKKLILDVVNVCIFVSRFCFRNCLTNFD
jgi:hypothetical protein